MAGKHRYDAFITYRREDEDRLFVRQLLGRLEERGYCVAIDDRDFAPQESSLLETERCIRESRFTIAVISSRYLGHGPCEEEIDICRSLDVSERKRRLIPLWIEAVEPPVWLADITGIDYTEDQLFSPPFESLVRALGPPGRETVAAGPVTIAPMAKGASEAEPAPSWKGNGEYVPAIDRTVTLLFSDMEGSTRLLQRLGDRQYAQVLKDHRQLLHRTWSLWGGQVIDAPGEEFFVSFPQARNAVAAALEAQKVLAAHPWPEGERVQVRIGIHTGEPPQTAEGPVGLAVHQAARVTNVGHGGQVLLSRTTAELVRDDLPEGAALKDLDLHRLKDLRHPERLFQLLHPDLRADFPPLTSLNAYRHNLPVQPTTLVGRAGEVEKARDILLRSDVRLLTVTGPGGMGKTRLGIQLAAEVVSEFADGVFFVPLEALEDPELVPRAIAGALGLTEEAEKPMLETLRQYLKDRETLLLLDNFERLLDAALCIADLLQDCARLKVVVTSRIALELRWERKFPLRPLPLPHVEETMLVWEGGRPQRRVRWVTPHCSAITCVLQCPSTALFVDLARAGDPAFSVTEENASIIARICERVGGIPLAIELVVRRLSAYPLLDLLAELEERLLPLLTSKVRDLPDRQRRMEAVIAGSYESLSDEARPLFRCLSVFVGSCSRNAAKAVAGVSFLDEEVVEELLGGGLLYREEQEEARYQMLPPIREYGQQQLKESKEEARAQQRHAHFFLEMAEAAERELRGADPGPCLRRLDRDHANLRTALRWTIHSGEVATGLHLGSALWRFWRHRGHLREGNNWLEKLLALPCSVDHAPTRARTLNAAGFLAHDLRHFQRSAALHQESLGIAQGVGDRETAAHAHLGLGNAALDQERHEAAKTHFEEALAYWQQGGDRWWLALLKDNLAQALFSLNRIDEAASLFEEILELKRTLGNPGHLATTLNNLAYLYITQQNFKSAEALLLESLTLFEQIGEAVDSAHARVNLARVYNHQGEFVRAVSLLAQAKVYLAMIEIDPPPSFQVALDTACHGLDGVAYEDAWRQGEAEARRTVEGLQQELRM